MAIIFAGPYETANMSQAQWEEVESKLWSNGVINGARNSFTVTTTSGLGVSVNTGDAMVDGFRFYSDTATALTATAADPTNPRIDRVILRVDGTGHTATIVIKAGTPAPSPTPPALTQTTPAGTFEISLAQIRINAGATTIASLTDERTYTTAAIGPNAITSAQIASVNASAVQAGALPAGVTLPASQLTTGALPGGVTLPATQLTSGAVPAGVTVPLSQVTDASQTFANGSIVMTNGNLTLTNGTVQAAQVRPVLGNQGVRGIGIFAGTGSGGFSHGAGGTPFWIGVTPHVAGSATIGYDSETSTTTNITLGASLAWRSTAWT